MNEVVFCIIGGPCSRWMKWVSILIWNGWGSLYTLFWLLKSWVRSLRGVPINLRLWEGREGALDKLVSAVGRVSNLVIRIFWYFYRFYLNLLFSSKSLPLLFRNYWFPSFSFFSYSSNLYIFFFNSSFSSYCTLLLDFHIFSAS